MLEFLRQLATGIRDAWGHLSVNARVQIGLTAFLTIGLIVTVVVVGSRPQFVTLYSRIDLSDSNEIIVWLADNDIPYQLKDGGQTIKVPIQHVQTSRVSLVDLGLPRTQGITEGFELFDNRDLMTNQWLQNVDYMRALRGTLQRQLNDFDFVRSSLVFISESQEQLFVSEQKPSEAAVTLDTTRPLTPREVKAILHIVSSFGGPNLNEKNITLTLSDGTLLHSPVADAYASMAGDQLEAQVARETEREAKVHRAFEAMGRQSVIRVSAVMNWTHEEKTEKTVSPGTAVSSMTVTSTTTSREGPPQGAPGVVANIPDGGAGSATVTNTSEDETTLENFEFSETLTRTNNQPGSVRELRVAAFIEGDTEVDDEGVRTYIGLTDDQISDFQSFIANTVGEGVIAADVVVKHLAFDITGIAAAQVAALPAGVAWYQNRVVQLFMQGILILGAFIILRIFMKRALVIPSVEEEEAVEIPEATREDMRRMDVAAEVDRLSLNEPENVAALLRSWMGEEE